MTRDELRAVIHDELKRLKLLFEEQADELKQEPKRDCLDTWPVPRYFGERVVFPVRAKPPGEKTCVGQASGIVIGSACPPGYRTLQAVVQDEFEPHKLHLVSFDDLLADDATTGG